MENTAEVRFTKEEATAIREVFNGLNIKLTAPEAATLVDTWKSIDAKLTLLTEPGEVA